MCRRRYTFCFHSKVAAKDSVEGVKQSKIFSSDPKRWNALSIVKSFVIQHAIPFSMFEDPRVRHTLSVLVPGDKFDVEALHNKAVSLSSAKNELL